MSAKATKTMKETKKLWKRWAKQGSKKSVADDVQQTPSEVTKSANKSQARRSRSKSSQRKSLSSSKQKTEITSLSASSKNECTTQVAKNVADKTKAAPQVKTPAVYKPRVSPAYTTRDSPTVEDQVPTVSEKQNLAEEEEVARPSVHIEFVSSQKPAEVVPTAEREIQEHSDEVEEEEKSQYSMFNEYGIPSEISASCRSTSVLLDDITLESGDIFSHPIEKMPSLLETGPTRKPSTLTIGKQGVVKLIGPPCVRRQARREAEAKVEEPDLLEHVVNVISGPVEKTTTSFRAMPWFSCFD